MEESVTIEWSYFPENYIEHKIKETSIEFEFLKGKVRATLPASHYDAEGKILEKLHNRVKAFFDSIMISKRENYTLSKPSRMEKIRPDGKKNYTLFVESIPFELSFGDVHFLVKDAAGNSIKDTKAKKQQSTLEFAELSAKHGNDFTVSKLLQAYTASIKDPANEFVHLYEIKDALRTRFGKESIAKTKLGISDDDWKPIGKFPNDPSMKQGRHRGLSEDVLRDATQEELRVARQIAENIILAYLKYID